MYGWQVRDEHRTDYDNGRGGYGQLMWQEIEARKQVAMGQMEVDNSYGYEQEHEYTKSAPQRRRKQQQQQHPQESYQPQRNPRARGDDDD